MPIDVQPLTGWRYWNSASRTPEPASAELDETVIVPETAAPAPGAVSEPVGLVASTTQV